MNEIFNQSSDFIIAYIDDVLVYSDSIEQNWKHLNKFVQTVKSNGLSLPATKMNLFQTKIRFLGHHIHQETITPIQRSIEFADKFLDEIKDKKQLQCFLGSLNYVLDFIQDLNQLYAPLRQRLKKNLVPWNEDHTKVVKIVKSRVKTLPCLALAAPEAFKIVETDASNIGYGGILKQRMDNQEKLVRYTSGTWNNVQLNYNTIKKEILSIVLCISKFQDDLLNQTFLLRVDCKSAKLVLQKDVKNIVSTHIFARW